LSDGELFYLCFEKHRFGGAEFPQYVNFCNIVNRLAQLSDEVYKNGVKVSFGSAVKSSEKRAIVSVVKRLEGLVLGGINFGNAKS
jgi:hypothetical protein